MERACHGRDRSPAPQPDAYARVLHRFGLAGRLGAAEAALSWDAQTNMPKGGAWARGEEMAALTEVQADLTGSDAAADELAQAEEMAGALEPVERTNLAEMRRHHIHAAAAPRGSAGRAVASIHRPCRRSGLRPGPTATSPPSPARSRNCWA